MARELAKRYAEQGIISLSVNPGELTCIWRGSHVQRVFMRTQSTGNIRTEIRRYAPALERKFSVRNDIRIVALSGTILMPHFNILGDIFQGIPRRPWCAHTAVGGYNARASEL